MSNSLLLHVLQHARLPCPSPSPGVCSNSCPLSQWCHPTISFSVARFSSRSQSFQHQSLFQWVSSSPQAGKVKFVNWVKFKLVYEELSKQAVPGQGWGVGVGGVCVWKIITWLLRDNRVGIQDLIPSCVILKFGLYLFLLCLVFTAACGLLSSCGAWASPCGGFSPGCRAWAPGCRFSSCGAWA